MFDEIAPKNPNEPEDIFAKTTEPAASLELKSALANQKLKPVGETAPAAPGFGATPFAPSTREKAGPEIEISPPLLSKKSVFVVVGVVLIVGLGAATAWGIWRSSKKATPQNAPFVNAPVNETPAAAVNAPVNAVLEPVVEPVLPAVTEPASPVTPPPAVDTDGDGLTDEEEAKYGTDAQKVDTDTDTLTDYEEIMIWKTDPLNLDTDGDTYDDGMEVKNGYNPLGAGKLLELPTQ